MAKPRSPEDLTIEELRRLLIEKRRKMRSTRLENYQRSGRVMLLSSDLPAPVFGSQPDAPAETSAALRTPAERSLRQRFIDGLLLLVEIAAVFGLLFLVFSAAEDWRAMNAEFTIEQPTFSPTPLISAVVLPSGHTPPTAPGGAAPNEAEIPNHLRPLVQQLASLPIPTPAPQQGIRIQIPGIGIDAPIVQGDGWEQLKKGVGQHIGTANPGDTGNVVLSAHNDVFGEIFRDLDKLKPGDQIIIHSAQRSFTYVVTGTQVVEPTQVEVMGATTQPVITLISCYPYLVDNKRIVVRALLQNGSQ